MLTKIIYFACCRHDASAEHAPAHPEQPLTPQEGLPAFLSFTIERIARATIPANMMPTTIVPNITVPPDLTPAHIVICRWSDCFIVIVSRLRLVEPAIESCDYLLT